ncbi:fungal-specific transcription factor domain-containing protein [Crucibulum laeve]|uniref:Fungal-specific transcription factor domain-containing protein n=1 Tax=Crucibulum laeve TaxID=68775 RepID=A0A5C3M3Q5_9AGAR|nr:fungal-specific transcription factor domain-containing protein [Crucibulum laeve]
MLQNQTNPQNGIPPPSSLQSALAMDPNQHLQLQQQQQQQQQITTPQNSRKRGRKADGSGDDAPSSSEPRRLRRSHEACARCRSKKIKCDSKHPRCTACATAGTVCHQEDRHRQTLTPRGHTERIELKLAQCEALLKRHYPNFTLDGLDDILAREGIDVSAISPPPPTATFQIEGSAIRPSFRPDAGPPPQQQPPKGYPMYPPPPPHMMHPYGHMMPYGPPPGPYQMPMQPPPGPYNPHIHPAFQHPPPGAPYPPPPMPQQQPPPQVQQQPPPPVVPPSNVAKGTDPNGNDMSNTEALAKNFGVHAAIVNDLKLNPGPVDKEDLAVGSSGLSSGRDRTFDITSAPRDATNWVSVSVRRNSTSSAPNMLSLPAPSSDAPSVDVWLPKDRKMVHYIVDVYFTRLNHHRPVYVREEFEKILNDLYDGQTIAHDPGYVCSVYLILALGTLSELNHRAVKADIENKADAHLGTAMAKKLMPSNWPEHDEFFERALSVKPDLRVTISSLQALILLHWYLYTERQGRTLWRLVGSLVRLSIELGLHHDPTTQLQGNTPTPQPLFTEEECQLRIRLWGIVLVHDRGTSILLGRPLAIAPSDSNTPRPSHSKNFRFGDFSEHFELSHPIAEFQADIINSLYTPKKQSGDQIMRNATRIIKGLSEFRRGLPERYKHYFSGTNDWPLDKRSQLVQGITEDEGLTLLKIGIARILMLRALFSSKELSYGQRHKALLDAIVTSHNTIVVHNQLIRFPDIAFFTSPIPLHIAAMVILYGHMSKCNIVPIQSVVEDVWLALDMLPRFRWRWERKDANGGHPLIAKLAERVMDVDLHAVKPSSNPVLMSELEWDEDIVMSPLAKSQHSTPTLSAASYATSPNSGGVVYGPQPRSLNGTPGHMNGGNSGGSTPPDKHLVDVPTGLFYPFYPEAQMSLPAEPNGNNPPLVANGNIPNGNPSHHHQDYSHILAAAAAAQDGAYGYQSSHDTFIEEHGTQGPHSSMPIWMNAQQQQQQQQSRSNLASYVPPS